VSQNVGIWNTALVCRKLCIRLDLRYVHMEWMRLSWDMLFYNWDSLRHSWVQTPELWCEILFFSPSILKMFTCGSHVINRRFRFHKWAKQQPCLLNIIWSIFPAQCNTTSLALDAVHCHIRSPLKLCKATLTYSHYTQSTSHTHITLWRLLLKLSAANTHCVQHISSWRL